MSSSNEGGSLKSALVVASVSAASYLAYRFMTRSKQASEKYKLWGKEVEIDIPSDVFPTSAELQAKEDTMPGCQHGWFQSCCGLQLHYRKFLPPKGTPIKGLVVFQHGIQTHSGKSYLLENGRKLNMALRSEELLKAGYALYALDMLGHGFSEGDRWYVPDWKVCKSVLVV